MALIIIQIQAGATAPRQTIIMAQQMVISQLKELALIFKPNISNVVNNLFMVNLSLCQFCSEPKCLSCLDICVSLDLYLFRDAQTQHCKLQTMQLRFTPTEGERKHCILEIWPVSTPSVPSQNVTAVMEASHYQLRGTLDTGL